MTSSDLDYFLFCLSNSFKNGLWVVNGLSSYKFENASLLIDDSLAKRMLVSKTPFLQHFAIMLLNVCCCCVLVSRVADDLSNVMHSQFFLSDRLFLQVLESSLYYAVSKISQDITNLAVSLFTHPLLHSLSP